MVTSLVSFTCLVISQSKFITLNPWLFSAYLLFLFFTIVYYVVSLVVNFGARSFDLKAHQRFIAEWRAEKEQVGGYPSVDFKLPVAGESLEVLNNTWLGVADVMREYPGRVTAFVLDDSQSPDVAALVATFKRAGYAFEYGTRPPVSLWGQENVRGWFKKAGNLRYGFILSAQYHRARGENPGKYSAVLDADFRPRGDYLWEILPYLERDPRLAIVQTPQYFHVDTRTQNWLERGAGAVQELFYRSIQQARDRLNGAICVGTNAIYRRQALEENGGGPTLIGHSEDVHTGFDCRYRCKTKWRLKYIPINLATGACPNRLQQFLQQQYRWCMGSMSLLGSLKFWAAPMGFRTRFCYMSGFFYYIHTAIFTFVGPTIPIVLLAAFPQQVRLVNYAWIVPSLVYNSVVFPVWHRCRYGLDALAVKLVYGWAHTFALLDILRDKRMGWNATGSKKSAGSRRIKYARWLIGGWGYVTGLFWVLAAVYYMVAWSWLNFLPNLLTGLIYCAIVTRAISPTEDPKPRKKRVQGRHSIA